MCCCVRLHARVSKRLRAGNGTAVRVLRSGGERPGGGEARGAAAGAWQPGPGRVPAGE